jgi:hypothetical protein
MRLGLRHLRGRFAECDALGDVAVPRPLHEHLTCPRLPQPRDFVNGDHCVGIPLASKHVLS